MDEEVAKYKKKKTSSISKSHKKSKHKHQYVDCLFVDSNNSPHKGTYCSICGKIGHLKAFETERNEDGYYVMISDDKVFEKYKGLEQIHVDDIFQQYVSIEEE